MPGFGKVVGRFLTPVVDTDDPDTYPDLVPLNGRITFLLNVSRVVEATASPDPVVLASTPIVGILDEDGYLCTPDAVNAPAYQGLWLVATDDDDLNPTDMQYSVTYALTVGLNGPPAPLPTHNLAVLEGETVDLALVIPPDSAPPMGTAAAEAAAAIAVAALAEMVQSDDIRHIVVITQSAYDAMTPPRPSDILYIITS